MSKRRIASINTTAIYIIALVAIIVACLLLGGGHWLKGVLNGSRSMNMANLNWIQIIISLAVGFLLGLLAGTRKR
jgi:ABC-type antimicrobial peptide transport system permease subunit